MKQTKTIEIDGVDYIVTQLGATVGVKLGYRLVRAIGPSIVKFFEDAPKDFFDKLVAEAVKKQDDRKVEQLDMKPLIKVVFEAVQGVDPELLLELSREFALNTRFRDDTTPGGRGRDGEAIDDDDDQEVKEQKAKMGIPLSKAFDDHFAGRYGSLLRWFIACARFNFSGFFSKSSG